MGAAWVAWMCTICTTASLASPASWPPSSCPLLACCCHHGEPQQGYRAVCVCSLMVCTLALHWPGGQQPGCAHAHDCLCVAVVCRTPPWACCCPLGEQQRGRAHACACLLAH
eukprot:scaffold15745_cov25-Tisochrysis_lutea.AAC.3